MKSYCVKCKDFTPSKKKGKGYVCLNCKTIHIIKVEWVGDDDYKSRDVEDGGMPNNEIGSCV